MNYVYFEKRFSSLTEEFQKSNRSRPFLFQSSKIVYRSHFSYVHIRSFRGLSGKTVLSGNAVATHGARKIRALRHCPPPRCAAWHRAPRPCPVMRARGGRARCPHRAAAPSARCAAWQVAHAESFACRGSVRGTVCGRAAHPARCPYRAAITHGALRTATGRCGAMGTSRPTAITHARGARKIRTRITRAHCPGGSPPGEANRTKMPSMASDQVP